MVVSSQQMALAQVACSRFPYVMHPKGLPDSAGDDVWDLLAFSQA